MVRPEKAGSDFERRLRRELAEKGMDCQPTFKWGEIEIDIPVERGLWNQWCPKIAIEAKYQRVGGSVDDKLPTQLRRWEDKAPELLEYYDRLAWVIDGPGVTARVWRELEEISDKVKIIKYSENWLDELL